MKVRKFVTIIEETVAEAGRQVDPPVRKAAALAIIENPFVAGYQEDLGELMDVGEALGDQLGRMALAVLGGDANKIHNYGKGAIVGENGELEHAAAILHPKLGKPLRDVVGGGKAIIPSAKKMGGPGCCLDVPLHFKDAAYVRTHYDAMEVRVADGPRANEILVAVVLTDGGRPLPRCGGLQVAEVVGDDGLR
ncbi:MAG: amino acid synthesis family protein [Thermoleophilia bacterium]|nr:amino acid synthesis family protein [Thermoleophilia bacterium]